MPTPRARARRGVASTAALLAACGAPRSAAVPLAQGSAHRPARPDAGASRDAARPDDELAGAGMSLWLRPLALFEQGDSALVGTYQTYDGNTEYSPRVWSVHDGELRQLYRDTAIHEMGAPSEYELAPRGPRAAAPAISVSWRAGALSDDAPDGPPIYRRPARVTVRRFDPRRRLFR